MNKLTIEDVMKPKEYEGRREAFRASVVEHKKSRRIGVGKLVSLVFEDRQTLRFQVMEMCRAEQISDDAKIQEELDTYNELMPGDRELSATMFVEMTNEAELREWMPKLPGVEHHVALHVGDAAVPAKAEGGRSKDDATSSVHYLKFPLSDAAISAWRSGSPVRIVIDHGGYQADVAVPDDMRASLTKDLDLVPRD